MFSIYKLSFDNYYYFGISKNVDQRFKQHIKYKNSNLVDKNLYNKMRLCNDIKCDILDTTDEKNKAFEIETNFIRDNLENINCLNERLSLLTIDDKKQRYIKYSKNYRDKIKTNPEKRKEYLEKKRLYMKKKRFYIKKILPFQNKIDDYNKYKQEKISNRLI